MPTVTMPDVLEAFNMNAEPGGAPLAPRFVVPEGTLLEVVLAYARLAGVHLEPDGRQPYFLERQPGMDGRAPQFGEPCRISCVVCRGGKNIEPKSLAFKVLADDAVELWALIC